jgi:hypothetical protein
LLRARQPVPELLPVAVVAAVAVVAPVPGAPAA